MSENKRWRIKNFEGFCKQVLKLACEEIGIDKGEYKNYITVENVKQIVKQKSDYEDNEWYLDDNIYDDISTEIQNWVLGVQLSKMCSSGKVDCYWDSKNNCMVFKVADNEKEGD